MAFARGIHMSCWQKSLLVSGNISLRSPLVTVCCAKAHTASGKAQNEMKTHWQKNERKQRPISPHLTIWRFQLPMNTSLMHRITGCAMTGALYVFGYTICALPGDYATYLNMVQDMSLGPFLINSAKFVLAYPLVYHAINGARHLGWDNAKGFDMGTIYRSGWFAFIGSAVIAAAMTQL